MKTKTKTKNFGTPKRPAPIDLIEIGRWYLNQLGNKPAPANKQLDFFEVNTRDLYCHANRLQLLILSKLVGEPSTGRNILIKLEELRARAINRGYQITDHD